MTVKKSSGSRQRSRIAEPKKAIPNVKTIIILAVIAIVIVVVVAVLSFGSNTDGNQNNGDTSGGNPIAVFNTNLGTFKVELYRDKMPETCDNFIKLANDGFYDGMNFYRILDNFMIQAGRYFPDESESQSPYGNIDFEVSDVKHVDGAISMASTGSKVGGSAEFFICDGAQAGLDGSYAAFGVTIDGLTVVHNIAAKPHDGLHPAGGGKPDTDIVINSITIE